MYVHVFYDIINYLKLRLIKYYILIKKKRKNKYKKKNVVL